MIRTSRPVKEKKRPFRCEMCRYSFGKRSDLKRHYLIHTGNNFFKSRQYFSSTTTGERPHKCHICGKAFRVKSALKDHLRIHENERDNSADQPTCTVCNKVGNLQKSLRNIDLLALAVLFSISPDSAYEATFWRSTLGVQILSDKFQVK